MIYIFIYNVTCIKSDFVKLKKQCQAEKFILIGSNYCLQHLSTKNRPAFDVIHPIARNFHNIDYEKIRRIIEPYVQAHGSEGIRLLSNEDSTQIGCSKIREYYNIPGDRIGDVLPFVNKVISKKRLQGVVNVPKYVLFDKIRYAEEGCSYLEELVEKLSFPMFAKPVDMVSSIGTCKINDFSELKHAADNMLIDVYVFEIDEFVEGDLFHCDLILAKGEVKFFSAREYAFPLSKFSQGFPMGSIAVTDDQITNGLSLFSKQVVKQLEFQHGGIHLEVFLNHDTEQFIFLEIAARTPGAMMPRGYEVEYDINIEEWHYLAHMNSLSVGSPAFSGRFFGWLTFPTISGVLSGIRKPQLNVEYELIKSIPIGQLMESPENLLDVSCNIIFWDIAVDKVKNNFDKLKKFKPLLIGKSVSKTYKQEERLVLNLENHFEIMEILFNTMPYVFWKDRAGRYLGCNMNQARAFQCGSVPDFIGKTAFDLLPNDPDSAKIVEETDNAIMASGKPLIVEEKMHIPGGLKIYLSQKQPLYDSNGVVIGMLGFAVDITEIKEKERLAKEQSEKLVRERHQLEINHYKQLSREQEKFTKLASQVAHDIRSPLASLLMNVKSCVNIPEDDRIALRESAMSIGDIANNLLHQYEKKENENLEDEQRRLILVSTTLSELLTAKKYQYQNQLIKFECHFGKDTEFAFIKAQPSHFKRMLSNLINNAVDAVEGKSGKITLYLQLENEWLRIRIQDNGQGMSEEVLSKICNKMSVTSGKEGGHGLGLSQVWQTIETNHGEMHVNSTQGIGTEIKLNFPRMQAPYWIATEIVLYEGDTVVILDDDSSIHTAWRKRFEMILNRKNWVTLKYFNQGKEALAFVQSLNEEQKRSVFLLTDYELLNQSCNGLQVVQESQIKRSILVTSHYANSSVRAQADKTGTRILPKQLASEVPISVLEKTDQPMVAEVVILEDNQVFSNSLKHLVFSEYRVDQYFSPEDFLNRVQDYPVDTKIYLDYNYDHSMLTGLDIAEELHQKGYRYLYLLTGKFLEPQMIPDYVKLIKKENILEIARNIDGL